MFTQLIKGWRSEMLSFENRRYLTVSNHQQNINIAFTTRTGGHSSDPYQSFNLATHVQDDNACVEANRLLLKADFNLNDIAFLNQTHSTKIKLDTELSKDADGVVTDKNDVVAAILTADCVPIIICDRNFKKIAAIHAGWRGLLNGIVESGFEHFNQGSYYLVGPHITQPYFEVGSEVLSAFGEKYKNASGYFKQHGDRFLFDMKGLINDIAASEKMLPLADLHACTYSLTDLFFSYRRDGECGRQASAIWRSEK
jgi:polyphenol oxidase